MASFPMRAFMEYGAYRTAPGSARGLVRNALEEWRLDAFEEKASLVVTELTTNSVIATEQVAWEAGRPPIRLWLLAGPDGVLVAVWDAVATSPRQRVAGDLDENGRGLGIVDAYCARWDCYRPPAPYGGKVTRALISDPHTEGSEPLPWEMRTKWPARAAHAASTKPGTRRSMITWLRYARRTMGKDPTGRCTWNGMWHFRASAELAGASPNWTPISSRCLPRPITWVRTA
jgi:anti-sigma regulatory factor (Ser/Thr protein kinase)